MLASVMPTNVCPGVFVARHNRTAHGMDQREDKYEIDYPPDWLRRLRVTRCLEGGRQSTMNVFRNPLPHRREAPGPTSRNAVRSPDGKVDFSITMNDPNLRVRRVTVTYDLAPEGVPPRRRGAGKSRADQIVFTFDGDLKPTPDR